MEYPTTLVPVANEVFKLSTGEEVLIPKTTPTFRKWAGNPIEDSYGGKTVIDADGQPLFAEFVVLKAFQDAGWNGVWIDTYRKRFRTIWSREASAEIPREQQELLDTIFSIARSKNGVWDVFCWKGNKVLFAESKRRSNDRIRSTQISWLEAALDSGLRTDSFLLVEWTLR